MTILVRKRSKLAAQHVGLDRVRNRRLAGRFHPEFDELRKIRVTTTNHKLLYTLRLAGPSGGFSLWFL